MDLGHPTPFSLPSPPAAAQLSVSIPTPQQGSAATTPTHQQQQSRGALVQPQSSNLLTVQAKSGRRRAGSMASSMSASESVASIYEMRMDEIARSKEKEMERVRSRLREAMEEATEQEDRRAELEEHCADLTSQLMVKSQEADDLVCELERMQAEGLRSKDLRRRHSLEMHEARKEALAVHETAGRAAVALEASSAWQGDLERFASACMHAAVRLTHDNGNLRKQIKEMQLRLDSLRELGECLKQQQQQAQHPPQDPALSERLEQSTAELAGVRRELDDAHAALRAERALSAGHLDRATKAEATRDSALRQLAELPDLERHVDHLARSKLGETQWLADKQHLEALLQQRNHEVASLTRKRERAKRREQEALAEITRLKAIIDAMPQVASHPHAASMPPPHMSVGAHSVAGGGGGGVLTPRSTSAATTRGAYPLSYASVGAPPRLPSYPPCAAGGGGGAGIGVSDCDPYPLLGRDGTEMSVADLDILQYPPFLGEREHGGAVVPTGGDAWPDQRSASAAAGGASATDKDAEIAFLRARVRELTHQGRYASGFSTPSLAVERHLVPVPP